MAKKRGKTTKKPAVWDDYAKRDHVVVGGPDHGKVIPYAETDQAKRATKKAGQGGTVAARVAHIADLMRTLEFRTGSTAKELAIGWDLSLDRVWELTAMASKIVKAEVTDPDRVQAKVCTSLEWALDRAKDTGDTAQVVNAAKTWAVIGGTAAPTKTQEVGLEGKSEAELAAYFVSILTPRMVPLVEAALKEAKGKK